MREERGRRERKGSRTCLSAGLMKAASYRTVNKPDTQRCLPSTSLSDLRESSLYSTPDCIIHAAAIGS